MSKLATALYDAGLREVDAILISKSDSIAKAVVAAVWAICDDFRLRIGPKEVASAVAGALLRKERVNQRNVAERLGLTFVEFQKLMVEKPELRKAYEKTKKELSW